MTFEPEVSHFKKILEKYNPTLLHQRIAMSPMSDTKMEQTVLILVTETDKKLNPC
jgi:hypothetical protein